MFAALAMSLSSVSVIVSSLMLNTKKSDHVLAFLFGIDFEVYQSVTKWLGNFACLVLDC
jgi:hypothetical protein